MSFSLKNIIPYFFEFFYRLQSGTALQTAPPRNDLNPRYIAGTVDGAYTRLEGWKFRSFDCVVFEGSAFEAVHQLTVDLDVLIQIGNHHATALGPYHYYHRTAAIEFNIRSTLKSSGICNRQFRSVSRHRLLSRKAILEGFAVEGHGKAADLVQLLLNVQIARDDAVAEILRIVGVGDFVVSVRLGIQPALNVPQDSGKCGYILPSEEHCVGHLDVGKAAVRIDDVTASAGNGDELRIVLRCGEHILLLDMQTALPTDFDVNGSIRSAVDGVVGKAASAFTIALNITNFNNYSSEDIRQLTSEVMEMANQFAQRKGVVFA